METQDYIKIALDLVSKAEKDVTAQYGASKINDYFVEASKKIQNQLETMINRKNVASEFELINEACNRVINRIQEDYSLISGQLFKHVRESGTKSDYTAFVKQDKLCELTSLRLGVEMILEVVTK